MTRTAKYMIDNPLCACAAFETSSHCLLECQLFAQSCQLLLLPLPQRLNLNLLLYGDCSLANGQNIELFTSTQKFIKTLFSFFSRKLKEIIENVLTRSKRFPRYTCWYCAWELHLLKLIC